MPLNAAEVRVHAELVVRVWPPRADHARVSLLHRAGTGAFLSYPDDAMLAVIAALGLDALELELHPLGGSADGTG